MTSALQAAMDFIRAVRTALGLPKQLVVGSDPTKPRRPLFKGAAMEHNLISQRVMIKAGYTLVGKQPDRDGRTYGQRGSVPGQPLPMGVLPPEVVGLPVWNVELECLE